ncbi:MAG: RsmB/NOP family class I SAM-dependent RNA methyltransferase [Bernardetiaceae bacterium]|nr:RsmB/NOP family class I SAM-dependent RNA methyltransferase [Bernardetiaceae bacterium]
MKLHPNLVGAVVDGLRAIFGEQRYADKVIEGLLRSNPRWGSHDRGFIAETTYDMVRHWRLLWYLAGRDTPDLKPASLWYLFGVYWLFKGRELPEGDKFKGITAGPVQERWALAQTVRKLRYSYPDWLDDLAAAELGPVWDVEAEALNNLTQVVLRTNTLKTSRAELQQQLAWQNVESAPLEALPDALVLKKRLNVFGNPVYKQGLFEIQDAASQLIAPFAKPEPGMRVIDACAGAGGKSLHLAALMQNQGQLLSMDVEAHKLEELRRRSNRAGISIIETRLIENNKVIKRLRESADLVLLDAPCSGTGVLRRNPDSKWKLSPEAITEVKLKQQEILARYAQMTKPGGTLVYATCSILPSENQRQVENFLANSDIKFSFLEEKSVLPSQFGYDGFYMAKLERSV